MKSRHIQAATHVVAHQLPNGKIRQQACASLGRADELIFWLHQRHGGVGAVARIWLNGEVVHEGRGFDAPAQSLNMGPTKP